MYSLRRESGTAARGDMGEAQTDKVSVVTGPRTGGRLPPGPHGRHWGGQVAEGREHRERFCHSLYGDYKEVV